jgi:hypothetical protein
MDFKNLKSFDLKLYLGRFLTFNVWFDTWQPIVYCHYDKFVRVHMYVIVGTLHIEYKTLLCQNQ